MKSQLICFTLIIFCITNTLSATCDHNSMTTSEACVANTTCEWKAKTTGTCGDTTTNTAGDDCDDQTTSAACNGGCKFTPASTGSSTGTCADGTTLSDGTSACSTATTSTACNGGCTWTPDYECAVKTTSTPTNDSSFRLKSSFFITLLISLF